VVKQDIESQYDDDLTLGSDEFDDSYYTDADDLFEFSTNDESPISRLKSLVLSIDWEITDEVLLQFNEELIDLKGIWAGNNINLVYVQALEKISKYIYQNKANSHPNSIKLLLTLYYNLEKIVSSQDLSEVQKKEILLEDVKKFEALKRQISQQEHPAEKPSLPVRPEPVEVKKEPVPEDKLLNLKAIVLGIDWEITDQDLNDLRQEVVRLERQFADSRPKLILLQGIGTLGAYIKMKKSNAHADAFKVLHLFYESLEKIVQTPMSLEEEKGILFPAVEKFNAFKTLLGPTISPEAIGKKEEDEDEDDEDYTESGSGEIAPAFSDIPEEDAIGFQADEEAKSLGIEGTNKVASHIDNFFGETFGVEAEEVKPSTPVDTEEGLDEKEILAVLGFEEEGTAVLPVVERDVALQGVDVEADDEETDEPVVTAFGAGEDDAVAAIRGGVSAEDAAESYLSSLEDEQPAGMPSSDQEVARVAESIFAEDEALSPKSAYGGVDRSTALQGVEVETEADEDSDEVSLPMEGEEFAPALMASDEESIFSAKTLDSTVAAGGIGDELVGTLDDLFLEEEQAAYAPAAPAVEEDFAGDVGREEDLVEEIAEVASMPDESSDELSIFEAVGVADEADAEIAEAEAGTEPELVDVQVERADEVLSLEEQEEELDLFAEEGDVERRVEESAEVDTFFESLEPVLDEEVEELATPEVEEELAEPEVEVELAEPEAEEELAEPEVEVVLTEPEVEEELAAPEFEEPVDALFALEEVAAESGEEKIAVAPVEEAESAEFEDFALPYPAEEEAEEEDVVFELAEEPVEAPSMPIEPALEAVAAEEPEFEWTEEAEESIAPVFAGDEREDSGPAFAATQLTSDMAAMAADPLGGLHGCIESLGIELDDKVIKGLFQEINALRQKWSDRPLEKTFLQLLSTITQHIDQYRFEASSEAFNLLQSVGKALADLREDDSHSSQELLLAETLKVLEWQQGMLARQAVQKGEQLTFVAPVRAEGEEPQGVADAREDFDQQLQHYGETVEDVAFSTDERSWPDEQAVFPIEESEPDIAAAGEALFAQKSELSREAFAEELKQEIASLRLTLQKEIAELRNELKGS
jgi:pilus assembly protein FimV